MWRPGTSQPQENEQAEVFSPEEEQEKAITVFYNSKRHLSIHQQRLALPIHSHRTRFLWSVEKSRVTIVVGETGSGKSTQLPQYLLESNWCANNREIVVVVPRRLAAINLAQRVSQERGTELGIEVGYATGDETLASKNCSIRYVTDGVLLREIQTDPLLMNINVIIMDDCHERRLESDVLLGLLKRMQQRRKYLRVVVCSATIDLQAFVDLFRPKWMTDEDPNRLNLRRTRWDTANNSTKNIIGLNPVSIIEVAGRQHSIRIKYLKEPCNDYIEAALSTVIKIHCTERDVGGILVFLCGKEEVETLCAMIKNSSQSLDPRLGQMDVCPLYAALPPDGQIAAFRKPPPNNRKVVVSTNLSESSVTIENITSVIDCGFFKSTFFDSTTGIQILSSTPISVTSAIQRAGRAGRTRPGVCYRLYTESFFTMSSLNTMPEYSVPDILRVDLSHILLYLLSLGIDNFVTQIELPTPASSESIVDSLSELYALQAVDEFGRLTLDFGTRMAELSLTPKFARFLLLSCEERFNCSYEAIIICAMNYCGSPWIVPHHKSKMKKDLLEACIRSIGVAEGDLITLYNVYKQAAFYKDEDSTWISRHMINSKFLIKAEKIKNKLELYLKKWNLPIVSTGSDVTSLSKAICSGFFLNACRKQRDGTYALCRKRFSDITTEQTLLINNFIPRMVIHPQSILSPKQPLFLVFGDAIATVSPNHGSKTYLTAATPIDARWLAEVANHYFTLNLQSAN